MRYAHTKSMLAAGAALGIMVWASGAVAADRSYAFDIPAQPLSDSLRAAARVTGANILYGPEVVSGRTAPAIKGTMSAQDAMKRLTAGSGLVVRESGDRNMYLTKVSMDAKPARATPGSFEVSLLQAPAPAQAAPAAPAADSAALEEVVVTGSRLQATGFTAPTPVTTMSTEAIEQRAPISIAQALYDLPSLTPAGPSRNTFGSTTVGTNILNLRGLGATRTLVLVDGRRYVPMSTTTSFDTNLIPSGLVERTEIVTGGASAAYGSDAVTGVVNILLKNKLEGLHGSVQGGQSKYGDDQNYSAQLNGGFKIGDKLHIIAGGEYAKNDGVGQKGEGPYARPWGRQEYGTVGLAAGRAAGLPATYVGRGVEFVSMTPGGVIAAGPLAGTAFGAGGAPYVLQRGSPAGATHQANASSNYGYSTQARQPLEAAYERYVFLSRGTYELTDDIELMAEVNYGHNEGHNNTAEPQVGTGGLHPAIIIAGSGFTAPGFAAGSLTNPFIPAATLAQMNSLGLSTISLGKLLPENGGFSTNNESTTKQITLGAKGRVFGGWNWDVSFNTGENEYTLDVPNVISQASLYAATFTQVVNGQLVCGTPALNLVNPNLNAVTRQNVKPGCVPFNPFGPAAESAASLAYIQNHMFYYVQSKQTAAAANISGSPFSTWAGPVQVATGVEWRRNSSEATADRYGVTGGNFYGNYQAFGEKEITVKEGYLEVGAPLARDMFLVKSLDVNAAVRRTDYSTTGGVTSWKVGVTYEPTDFFRLRLTQSRDIRAPNIGELYASTGGVAQSSNPFSPNAGTVTVPNQSVGNPNLDPETADTFTAGVVLTPRWGFTKDFRISVDYYKIEISDAIGTLPLVFLQRQCFGPVAERQTAAYCNGIFGGYDPTFSSQPTGYQSIRQSQFNVNKTINSGIDLEVSYRAPIELINAPGAFNIRALVSWLDDNDTIVPATNALGVVTGTRSNGDNAGTAAAPEYRYTFNFNYKLGKFSSLVQLQGFSDIKLNTTAIGPDDPRYAAALSNPADPFYGLTIGKQKFEGRLYVNASVQYNLIEEGARRLQVFGNVDNMFNRDPPFGWVQTLTPYDTIGQTFRLGLRFDY